MKRTVTKPCQCCGSIMVNVNRQTQFCEDCRRIKSNAAARAAYHKNREKVLKRRRERRIAKNAEKPKKVVAPKEIKRIKPIEQCVREADALGLTYGQYVARGLDKECL
uniref:Zinc ribbon domain n=1 Tax=Ackermannviridae sp. TaxID=2831612 RepID=A0A8S5VJT5_9CAUD|nr:MAG TPA: Putative zinc ribbon domain [Ackermannviridae sp.]